MSLIGGWLLAPLVLAALCCGIGLLVERIAGVTFPGGLLPAVGLAGLIVLAGIAVNWEATAELATPLVAAAAVAGIVGSRPWRDERLGPATAVGAALAVATFAIYAAPSLLSGQGSIAGYIKLDDSAIWLTTVERAMGHARDVNVPPGSYLETLRAWLGSDYPIGAFLPLGVSAPLSGQDAANAYQPTIAAFAAILALAMWACVRPLLRSAPLAACAALVGVQASLFLGYAQWGGIKEACIAPLLAAAAWLAVRGGRALAVLVVVVGALLGVLGVNGLAWGGPALAVAALVYLRAGRRLDSRSAARAGALAVLLLVCALPAVTSLGFFEQTTSAGGGLRNEADLGNLTRPLRLIQGAAMWPAGDFRVDPSPFAFAVLLALAVVGAAIAAAVVSGRRGSWELPALMAVALIGTAGAVVIGSAWVDAKALAVFAPVPLLAAAALVFAGLESGRERVSALAAAGLVLLVVGCAWSTVAVLRDVYIAPRERLAELRDVGREIAGEGPTLQLDFDIYGNRYFLRDAAPEGATDLRSRPVRRADGGMFAHLTTAEVDDVATPDLWVYRTIVRRRSPVTSRPPAAFHLARGGAAWEVWQRDPRAPAPLARLPLGQRLAPAAVPACADVRRLARTPGIRALAAVPRRAPLLLELTAAATPVAWRASGGRPVSDGLAATEFQVPATGRWRAWVGGSVLGNLEVQVDGRPVGSYRHELAHQGQWLRFADTELAGGRHTVVLRYRRGPFWRAGRGAPEHQLPLGPIGLSPAEADRDLPVVEVAPRDYRRLCDGRAYDWIEAHGT